MSNRSIRNAKARKAYKAHLNARDTYIAKRTIANAEAMNETWLAYKKVASTSDGRHYLSCVGQAPVKKWCLWCTALTG